MSRWAFSPAVILGRTYSMFAALRIVAVATMINFHSFYRGIDKASSKVDDDRMNAKAYRNRG